MRSFGVGKGILVIASTTARLVDAEGGPSRLTLVEIRGPKGRLSGGFGDERTLLDALIVGGGNTGGGEPVAQSQMIFDVWSK